MGESNGTWGSLVEHDEDAAATWDTYAPLPDPGENPVLDAFCRRKRLTIAALVRVGAKLADDHVIAFGYDRAIKYRDMNDGRRWSRIGSTFPALKLVRTGLDSSPQVVVCEGETDGARLTAAYDCDVAILPAGARAMPPAYVDQLRPYPAVLVGPDDDEAGHAGRDKLLAALPQASEFRPAGGGDWCETDDDELPALPTDTPEIAELVTALVVPAGEMLVMEVPEIASWFEHDILPVGGSLVVHGWVKSFKSFLTFDMLSSLAQGVPWCEFAPAEEACRTLVVQYEVPWQYYRDRVATLRENAKHPELFDEHFFTYSPLVRPQLVAGNTQQEDAFLRELEAAEIQVVLFDPLRRMAGHADLNAENEIRKLLGFFERINNLGITVIYTHHDSKDSARARGGDALGMTGSGAIAGDPDSIVSIALPPGDTWGESTRRNLHFTLRNSPAISSRSMAIHESGYLTYSTEPYGDFSPDGDDSQDLPPI